MKLKRVLSLGLAAVTACSMLAVTGCGNQSADEDDNTFSWWIYMTDGNGTYYDKYEDNPAVEWLNQQYWDVENGTIGTAENGTSLKFTFQAPIAGSEQDNFNTMLSTGDYTDIMDLSAATDNAQTMVNEGILMDLTDYVEKYCPNYVALLDANPDIKALVTTTDEDGKTHYYQLACIKDGNDVPWGGYVYRRDWVVKYAEPTEYVWDWDSDYVKENGHPAVTPLDAAVASGNMEGWKVNEVTEFTSSEGEDPNNDYTDNVIFPSGKTDPYTISDWEWMFEAFKKAIDERGFADNPDAYCTTVYYPGFTATGDLVSSFGGGNGMWSKDADQNVYFDGTTDNFKTYLECLNHWNEEGWMDTRFETRASDMFFQINQTGTAQGMVGMWYSYMSSIGDTIRVTCANAEDQQDAYVMGCSQPINDVYGTDAQKFNTPDGFYQGSRISGKIGISTAAEDKSEDALAALFTMFNWLYTEDGARTRTFGLSAEQLASADIENNLYEENGLNGAYTVSQDEDGKTQYVMTFDTSGDIGGALRFMRLAVGIEMTGSGPNLDYTIDKGQSKVITDGLEQYALYVNSAAVTDYNAQFTDEQNETYGDIYTSVYDYMSQHTPDLIKNGLDGWDTYVEGLNDLGVDEVTEIYQSVVDELFGK